MPPMAIQFGHGAERLAYSIEHQTGAAITEVTRGKVRQDCHADVGRTRAWRDTVSDFFLVVVRRQPVLSSVDKHLEITPGSPGQLMQEITLRVRQADWRRR